MKATGNKRILHLPIDNIPYEVEVTPIAFNEEKRFNISINGGDEHVYVWDDQIQAIRPLDDGAAIIPEPLEKAIGEQLMHTVILH